MATWTKLVYDGGPLGTPASGTLTNCTGLPAAGGGTGQSSYTVGDIVYASATDALSRLAASTDGYVLTSTGAGSAPAWEENAGGSTISITDNNATDETTYITFVDGATGTQGLETEDDLTYNPSSGTLSSTIFVGALTGNVTGNASGSSGSCTGNALSATSAGVATTVTISDNDATDEDNAIIFTSGGDTDGGNIGLESDSDLTYNPSSGTLSATVFTGALTGNVTGNASGTAATVTTAAQPSITSLGTLSALTVDDIAMDGKTMTMTGASGDTAKFTVGTNGDLAITTVDTAAAAANVSITADGTFALSSTGIDISSAGVVSNATWQGTAVAVGYGGTGSANASDARTALGVEIGADVQAYHATLAAVAGSSYTGDNAITTVGALASGSLAAGFTDVPIAQGGTGSSTASAARTALGLEIGADVQAYGSYAALSGNSGQNFACDDLSVNGNISVSGTSTITNSTVETVNVEDQQIKLAAGSGAASDCLIVADRGDADAVSLAGVVSSDTYDAAIFYDASTGFWSQCQVANDWNEAGSTAEVVGADATSGNIAPIAIATASTGTSNGTQSPVGSIHVDTNDNSGTPYIRRS